MVKPWLENRLYTSALNIILTELMVNGTYGSTLLCITLFFSYKHKAYKHT